MTTESRATVVFSDVYEDLKLAYQGKHGYGGDVAEIYAYRLVEGAKRHPTTNPDAIRDWTDADSQLAADNLYRLLRDFLVEFPYATFAMQDYLSGVWHELEIPGSRHPIPPFSHRAHLKVQPRQVDDPKMAIYVRWKPEHGELITYRLTIDGGYLCVETDTGRDGLGDRYWRKVHASQTNTRVLGHALRAIAHGEYEREFRNGIEHYRVLGTFEEEI